ncbi:MAG: hypothetical protein U1E13_12400, partial [Methylophilaceae bacterium]|nr:hypothetical protein [Methylophilaceae bacterium]
FNPKLAIKVEEEWVNIYDLLIIERLAPQYQVKKDWWHHDHNTYAEKSMTQCKQLLRQLIAEKQR